jgi:hypothetical protein
MVEWFGYWEVWHVALASWLTLIGMRIWPYYKQKVLLFVLVVAVGYELSEIIWGQSAYATWRHQFGNSMKDVLAALIGFSAVAIATVNRKLL